MMRARDPAQWPSVRLAKARARQLRADHVPCLNLEGRLHGALLDEMAALGERHETAYDLPVEGGWW